MDFVIHNFRISNANVQNIEEYSKVKSDLAPLVNFIRKLYLVAQIYSSHPMYMLYSRITAGQDTFSFSFEPLTLYRFLGQHLDYGNSTIESLTGWLSIHFVVEIVSHANQSCSPLFICLSAFKVGMCFRFDLTVPVA